jgi:glycosyltransferase involved in cell wall biosynthesis
MKPTSALLISTYNWPTALRLVLTSAIEQTIKVNEILIADDGSSAETQLLIEEFQKKSAIPIRHFWQEDKGFRKSKILNKSLAATTVDYIIQVDGDCIMHPQFVEDHLRALEKGVYLYGSRVNILPNFVEQVLENKKTKFNFFSKEIKNKTRSIHLWFLSSLYQSHDGISSKFRGCNVSFWRQDFIDINGYNEDYEGWGREDSDLVIRMGNKGVKSKRLRYAGIVYHIYHKINSKHNFKLNDSMQEETIAKKVTFIENGVNKYF